MSDRQMTALERLTLSVAGIVIAAAIIGVYTTMQGVQSNQAEQSRELAIMSTQMSRVAADVQQQREAMQSNRERIRRLERQWGGAK